MKRYPVLLLLILAACPLARAQTNALINVFTIPAGGDCTVLACTSARRQMCRNTETGTTLYACDPVAGFFVPVASGGGGGSPGGSNTHCQFNDSGNFGGDAGCSYNKTTDLLTIGGGVNVTNGISILTFIGTNGISVPLAVLHTPATASNGDGAGFALGVKDSAGGTDLIGNIYAVSTDVTSGSEDSYMSLYQTAAGVAVEGLRITPTGLVLPASATVDGVNLDSIPDGNVSDTLTSSLFVGSGSTTTAIDLATAEAAGTLPFSKGGTNQTSWTASRCVQVNAGGTALESAAAACGSGGGTPGGSDTQCQFNNAGAFGGDAGCTYSAAGDDLTIGDVVTAASFATSATTAGQIVLSEATANGTEGITLRSGASRTNSLTVDFPDITGTAMATLNEASQTFTGSNTHTGTETITHTDGTTRLILDNTDEAADEGSPRLEFRNSTSAANDISMFMLTDASGNLQFREDLGLTSRFTIAQAGGLTTQGNITMSTAGATVDGKDLDLVPANARIVNICDTGAEYTTLNAACAAETSTAANPIEYAICPGVFTGQVTCSGEDHAVIRGAGMGATILTSTGNSGTLLLGTSTNIEVTGMTIHGTRSIEWLAAGTGGGLMNIHNMEFSNPVDPGNPEDCTFIDLPVAGSRLLWHDNICRFSVDGLTMSDDIKNVEVYTWNNTMVPLATSAGTMRAFRSNTDPCLWVSHGDTINITQSKAAAFGITGYEFTGELTGDCASTSRVFISGATSYIRNTSVNQPGSGSIFISIPATSGVDELYLSGVNSEVSSSDVDDTFVQNVFIDNTVTETWISGGKFKSSGGVGNLDFGISGLPANSINIMGVIYDTADDDTVNVPFRGLSVDTAKAIFTQDGSIEYRTINDNGVGIRLDNTAEGGSAGGPCIAFNDATVAAGDNEALICTDAGGGIAFRNDAFSRMAYFSQTGDMYISGSPFRVAVPDAQVIIGNGAASDLNTLNFDGGTTDGLITWNDTNDEWVYSGGAGGIALDDQLGLRLREEDAGGNEYVEFRAPATLAASQSFVWNVNPATCTGDGNLGALTVTGVGPYEINCSADNGGGGSLTVEEADASPTVPNVTKIQFDQADGFTVTDETGGQTQIDLAAVPDSVLASSYSGVGACGANTFASTLNDNAAPTCTQPAFSNLTGTATAAQGGTGDDTSATTGVPRIAAGNWTYDAGVSHLAASTSADLRGVLSDETGTGVALFNDPQAVDINVEDGTNAVTTVSKVYLLAATCQNATAFANFDTPTTNAPAATCITGTNTQKAYLDFDQTTDESVHGSLRLPDDWTGNVDVTYTWLTTATTGSVIWCFRTVCVNDAETGDPAMTAQDSATCVSDAAKGSASQYNEATDTAVTMGTGTPGTCQAGEILYYRIDRDPNATSGLTDDLAADARLVGVELTFRRAQ